MPRSVLSPPSRFRDGGGDLLHDGVAVLGGTAFFTIAQEGIVASIATDGSAPASIIANNQLGPKGIAVTDKAIYWANSRAGTIMRLAR